MKKNYIKPSLLSETFVTENIMTSNDGLSTANLWTLSGEQFQGLQFNYDQGGNTLYRISFGEFNK